MLSPKQTNKEAQWLRALVLAEVTGLIPITHTAAEEHPVPLVPGDRVPSSDLLFHQAKPMAHTNIHICVHLLIHTPCDF